MNDQIIVPIFNFQLLNSNFKIWKYQDVEKGDSLIVLRELDLTNARRSDGAVRCAHANDTWEEYDRACDQAKEEFKKSGKIKGFEILNSRTFDKLWISGIDMQVLYKTLETSI